MATFAHLLHRPWVASAFVAALGLVATASVGGYQQRINETLAATRFAQSADAFTEALGRRLDAYIEIALGLRGLFLVNPQLGRRDFVQAVERLDLATRHPEIKNLAFTRYVRGADKEAFVARVRADTSLDPQGYPGFSIRPPGERDAYFVADYLWPMQGNQGIHGLDISAQPVNLASMRYAQTTGKPVASGPFELLQETSQRTGFVIRVPVFRSPPNAARPVLPTDFLGAVAVTLRVRDVMERLRAEGRLAGLSVYLSDSGAAYAGQTFSTNLPLFLEYVGVDPSKQADYRRDLPVFGRTWRVEMTPAQSFLSERERHAPLWLELGGLVATLLAAAATGLVVRQRGVTAPEL